MRIGEAAKKTGLTIHTLRFYERRGLLPRVARGPSNYREYNELMFDRLDFIRDAQQLGFTLAEVRALLDIRGASAEVCAALRRKGEQKLQAIDDEIVRLQAMRAGLGKMLDACDADGRCLPVIALSALRNHAPRQPCTTRIVARARGRA